MEMADPSNEAKDELAALHKKLAAKRALSNPQEEEQRLYEEEQKRIAEQKAAEEAAERKKREDSRSRLKGSFPFYSVSLTCDISKG